MKSGDNGHERHDPMLRQISEFLFNFSAKINPCISDNEIRNAFYKIDLNAESISKNRIFGDGTVSSATG
jgi:hypothetical protein